MRGGTAKVLTLFRPAGGRVRVEGTRTCPNAVLHPWLKRELGAILAELPALPPTADTSRAAWDRWPAGLTVRITLPEQLPPLRVLLVLDNLTGHKTPALVLWPFAHGVMPLYTPLGGSWLNTAESIQRVLKRRALDGQHPTDPDEIVARFGAVAKHWNAAPTPFVWGGKRATRRKRERDRRHTVGGSGADTRRPLRRRYGHERGKCPTSSKGAEEQGRQAHDWAAAVRARGAERPPNGGALGESHRGTGVLHEYREAHRQAQRVAVVQKRCEKGERGAQERGPGPSADPAPIAADIRFHDLRHTHASCLIAAGYSIKAVSRRLGHSSTDVTLRVYAHLMPDDDEKVTNGVDALFG